MQQLRIYQAIWGMENLSGVDLDSDMASALDRIHAAGFDGVGIGLGPGRAVQSEAVSKGMRERGLTWEALSFVRNAEDLARTAAKAEELGAHHLTVQILYRTGVLKEAVAMFNDLERVAAGAGLPIYYETHRGRLTNDLLFMMEVLDELPDLKLTGDLSHYPVVHEMPLPIDPVDQARFERILNRCEAYHGRVSGSHQVQVSLTAPQHQGWVDQFRAWWTQGFDDWRSRSAPDATLSFMVELGPPHYAITDGDGREICDRWAEAQLLAQIARDAWRGDMTAN